MTDVEVVAEKRRDFGTNNVHYYDTICSQCGGEAYAHFGGSLWCHSCLAPLVKAGADFRPSMEVKR